MQLEVVAMALVKAMQSGKFGTDEHKIASDYIVKNSANPTEMAENLCRIGNVSAIRQWAEKYGYLSKNVIPDALSIHFDTAQETLAKAKLAAVKTPTPAK